MPAVNLVIPYTPLKPDLLNLSWQTSSMCDEDGILLLYPPNVCTELPTYTLLELNCSLLSSCSIAGRVATEMHTCMTRQALTAQIIRTRR